MLTIIQKFLGMSCFEIAHTPECANLFTTIQRKGKAYMRALPSHPICVELTELYKKDKATADNLKKGGTRNSSQSIEEMTISSVSSSDTEDEAPKKPIRRQSARLLEHEEIKKKEEALNKKLRRLYN